MIYDYSYADTVFCCNRTNDKSIFSRALYSGGGLKRCIWITRLDDNKKKNQRVSRRLDLKNNKKIGTKWVKKKNPPNTRVVFEKLTSYPTKIQLKHWMDHNTPFVRCNDIQAIAYPNDGFFGVFFWAKGDLRTTKTSENHLNSATVRCPYSRCFFSITLRRTTNLRWYLAFRTNNFSV